VHSSLHNTYCRIPVLHLERPARVDEPKQSTPQALQHYLNRVSDREALLQVWWRGVLAKESGVEARDCSLPHHPKPLRGRC